MKIKPILTIIALLTCISNASAETCTTTTTSTPAGLINHYAEPYIQYCTSVSYTNYYASSSGSASFSTPQCTACNRGYQLFTFYNGDGDVDWTALCNNITPSFTICAKPCDSSCVNDSYYSDEEAGVESSINRTCALNKKICKATTVYRCKNGYYGEAIDDSTGCTKCPTPTSDSHHTANSAAGEAESITDCFISKSNTANYFRDTTGNYKCTEDAYYKL